MKNEPDIIGKIFFFQISRLKKFVNMSRLARENRGVNKRFAIKS